MHGASTRQRAMQVFKNPPSKGSSNSRVQRRSRTKLPETSSSSKKWSRNHRPKESDYKLLVKKSNKKINKPRKRKKKLMAISGPETDTVIDNITKNRWTR